MAGFWLKELIGWMLNTFGLDIIILARDSLQSQWRRLFAARNILILGPRQSGKTSLVYLVQHGHPYEIVDGTIRAPNPTAVAAIIDEKVSLQQGNWLQIRRDVPGDLDLRQTWAQAIGDLRPHGIIFMADGRVPDTELASELIRVLREDVLSHYTGGLRELGALHLFLNFSDSWGDSPSACRRKERIALDAFESLVEAAPALRHLRFGVASTQLSPNRKSWEEATRALHKFSADLL